MQLFAMTFLATFALLFGGSWLISRVTGHTTQAVVQRTGKSNSQLWLMKPGIFLHELMHAVVGKLFGMRITEFSLRPRGESAAHVSFAYNPRSIRQRFGLFMSGSAPVWGLSAVLLVLAKRAWLHAIAWQALPTVRFADLQPDWPWVAAWAVVTFLLTFGMSLSPQDFRNMWAGTPIVAVLMLLVFAAGYWLWPALLAGWQVVNVGFAVLVGIMLVISIVVDRLVVWL